MAKHNYSQYSNKKYENKVEIQNGVNTNDFDTEVGDTMTNAIDTEITVTTLENKTVTEDEVIVTTLENKTVTESNSGAVAKGVVANCAKLNVRSKPGIDGDVVATLSVNEEVNIDVDESTNEWFKISTTAGVKGYCMRKFVNANI